MRIVSVTSVDLIRDCNVYRPASKGMNMGDFGNTTDTYIFYAVTAIFVALVSWAHIRSKWAKQKRHEAEMDAASRYRLRELNRLSPPF